MIKIPILREEPKLPDSVGGIKFLSEPFGSPVDGLSEPFGSPVDGLSEPFGSPVDNLGNLH